MSHENMDMDIAPGEEEDVVTVKTERSHGSKHSRASGEVYLKHKVKANMARKRLEYMDMEAELAKEKVKHEAELEATVVKLKRIKVKEEIDMAELGMKFIEEELDSQEGSRKGSQDMKDDLGEWNDGHTRKYVADQNELLEPTGIHISSDHFPNTNLCPEADPFIMEHKPTLNYSTHEATSANIGQALTDMTNFLTKKSFVMERIKPFSGKSEHYISWKFTFKEVMEEIDASPSVEIDIMLKHLRDEPYEQVKSIHNSNSSDSSCALKKAWERLDSFYGSPDRIAKSLKKKLNNIVSNFTTNDKMNYYKLSDTLNEIYSVKEDPRYGSALSYFDTSEGVNPVIQKFPFNIQNKWRERAVRYKKIHNLVYPPFAVFCDFVQEQATIMNDPSFEYDNFPQRISNRPQSQRTHAYMEPKHRQRGVTSSKTAVSDDDRTRCAFHNSSTHMTSECNEFRKLKIGERRDILRKFGLCFKCCDGRHLINDCHTRVQCDVCGNKSHCTGMHFESAKKPHQSHGGERPELINTEQQVSGRNDEQSTSNVNSACTEVCDGYSSRSCAKIVLVNIEHERSKHPPIKVYAVLDEQSNKSLAKPELFDMFDPECTGENYILSTCSGSSTVNGRRSHGFIVHSHDNETTLNLPTLIECDDIPDNRYEIPTREVAENHPHLAEIAGLIPSLDNGANISLLIGRDMLFAFRVLDTKYDKDNPKLPFAQRLPLGWVVIGEACLDGFHVNVMKTMLYGSVLEPCDKKMHISECFEGKSVFELAYDDNRPSMSIEDQEFLAQMDRDMKKDPSGNWIAPLPFRTVRPFLPNNRQQALDRAVGLDNNLVRNPTKKKHFLEFMNGLFEAGHVELAPPLEQNTECWYLPLFGVYHPQKKDKIRGVFDSSAKCNGLSLNDVMMSGPDLMNKLIGVLLRFRKESVAVMADIEQMFYCFLVDGDHRRYLRFIWHQENDFNKPLVDYQMRVHVFGNSPSPAVATYGLRRTADEAEAKYGTDMKNHVHRDFYVDDALSSHSTSEKAIDLLKRTREGLQEHGNLKLHKISSNSNEVLAAFDSKDLVKDLKDVELLNDDLPTQRSLGVCWKLQDDSFTFKVNIEDKPFTRRGVLSSINSLFDPLGFVAPVTIAGKAILREAMTSGLDWDEPLPTDFLQKWISWKSSLKDLENLQIPRTYGGLSVSETDTVDLLIFSDASLKAIAAVAYLRLKNTSGERLGFVMGKTKLAPKHGHTIPRLELCAAVLAAELYDLLNKELDINFNSVQFFTDSKVVMGYIQNETKRFFTYVANRVEKIRRCSQPSDWNYIPTKCNPADEGTRSVLATDMQNSLWLNGPPQLLDTTEDDSSDLDNAEIEVHAYKTDKKDIATIGLGSQRFERFSDWFRLTNAISLIQKVFFGLYLKNMRSKNGNGSGHTSVIYTLRQAETLIIKVVQSETFQDEIEALQDGKCVSRKSPIFKLDPFIDDTGLLRVGGRLRRSNLTLYEKNPLIIPRKSHIAKLLVAHFHNEVKHQGRIFTEAAIRTAGYWIVGCRRLVGSYIQGCVTCRKLRGTQQQPKMADLAEARLLPAPPFSHIGVDVFGPWGVVTRKTRGVNTQAKRWAVIFTCMAIRAIHIEVIEEMSASSFINALRRFTALRGEVRVIYSDCGTNFVGATSEMNINVIDINDSNLQNYVLKNGIQWKFNPPHASHMGGSWERLIGVSRKILDSLLSDPKVHRLTHEVLTTLMAEVCSIVNARPLTDISSDPQSPVLLTPATLLTMKTTHIVDSFVIEEFTGKDLFKDQWRCVQHLSNCFWKRWKGEYLSSLQQRKKWQQDERNLHEGDIVLLRDKTVHRNDWPMGIIQKTYESDDSRVRKITVCVGPDRKVYQRPSSEVVLLVPNNQ